MPIHAATDPAIWQANLSEYQRIDERGEPGGYAELGPDGKVPAERLPPGSGGDGGVTSVNGHTGPVTLAAADVGAVPSTVAGAANGVATLDSAGQVPASQLGNAGAGGGAVSSVNAQVGAVDLSLNDVIHGFVKVDPTKTRAANAAAALTIQTPDGSGQVVEPAIEYIPQGWNGHKFWALITGYTNGNAVTENPAIYYSDDGVTFTPVPGAPFPVVPKPANGFNADPELRLGPDGNLHGFYISFTDSTATGVTGVYWITSVNGVTWSTPQLLFQNINTTEFVIGPVVLYEKANNRWVMWYTHATRAENPSLVHPIRRRTCSGTTPGGPWSSASTCGVTGLPAGRSPWEAHIERRGDQIQMVTTLCDTGTGGSNTRLHYGISNDQGLSWQLNPTPLLTPSASGWDNSIIYRGDIVPVDDGGSGLYGLWYSGRSSAGAWRYGYTTITVQS